MQPQPNCLEYFDKKYNPAFGEVNEHNDLHGRGICICNGTISIGYYENGELSTGHYITINKWGDSWGEFRVGENYKKDGEKRISSRGTIYKKDGTEEQYDDWLII